MFIVGNFIIAVAKILEVVFGAAKLIIFVRVIISWVNPDPFNSIVQFLQRITEPILEPIRRLLPPMGLDISPVVAFLIIYFLEEFLIPSLMGMGLRLM